jgi:predicted AlkP superfamily pyrophosphatase or phosphodiesterase
VICTEWPAPADACDDARPPSRRARAVAWLAVLFVGACSAPPTAHVLIVGVDGVRPDALQVAATPHFDSLVSDGAVSWDAFAGGQADPEHPSHQLTSSGPGWSSILTGTWVDGHGVVDNGFADNTLGEHPHLFVRIRGAQPEAQLESVVHWTPIHEHLLRPFPDAASFVHDASSDAEVADVAVTRLGASDPDVLFLHFDDVDHAGHAHGYATDVPEYLASIATVDALLGQVLAALRARPTYADENWLVLATTDHGGLGTGHGGQSADERTIWIVAHGGDVEPGVVSPGPGHTAITRSALEHLGVDVPDDWGLADAHGFGNER